MKVIITGGLGFIGSNLATRLVDQGYEVVILDIMEPTSGCNIFNIDNIRKKVRLVPGDMEDFKVLCDEVSSADIVVNCAARTSHPNSMKEPLSNIDVNCTGVINLLESVRRFNPKCKVLQVGTTTQFGPLVTLPADELHPEFPLDIYSANKSVSEKYVRIYSKSYELDATIVRLPNIYGPRAAIHSSEFTFNNYFIGLALQNKGITVYGGGEQLRNVLYIEDAVDALIAFFHKKQFGEVYLATADSHYSVKEVAEHTVKYIGKGKVIEVEWPEERKRLEVGGAVFTNAKIKRDTDWRPKTTLEEGLTKTKEFYQEFYKNYIK